MKTQCLIKASGIKTNWQLYLMLLIPLAYIIIFAYQPMYGAQIAFRDFRVTRGILGSRWIGLDHLRRFISAPNFSILIRNTVFLNLYALLAAFPFPILLALCLNYVKNQRFKKLVQTTTYIPHFISVVVLVGILRQVLNPTIGIIGHLYTHLGLDRIDFFGKPEYFRSLYVWSGVWQHAGWGSIIYMAALSAIDPALHEAATIDGASRLRRIWHIDLPGILPTVVILFILNLGGFLRTGFEKAFLMQTPTNLGTSEVIDTYVYKMGLGAAGGNLGFSTAVGLFQSAIGFFLIVFANWLSKKVTQSSLW